ncbi:MAG TPA: hypothetical protein VHB02_08725 [Acidimicrobiales bacterium]|nr:hypothetical protein [Acidimicrobiales bacterium]
MARPAAVLALALVGLLVTGPATAQDATTGSVSGFGVAVAMGSPAAEQLAAPLAGMAPAPDGDGYWLLGADGGVFTYGNAGFFGSEAASGVQVPFVGMAATPDGNGYWLVTTYGGVFPFGDAGQYGQAGSLDAPVVGMAATPDGNGYWLVAADGGVFSFGDAPFLGSLGGTPPGSSTPVVAVAADPVGAGYWLTTTDRALPPSGPVPSVLATCNLPGSAPAVEPSTIMLACGDGNAYLDHLTWSSWTPSGATGSGTYTHNLCQPDCAQGRFVSAPTTVRLAYPIATGRGREFSQLSYTTAGSTRTTAIPTSPG